MLPDPPVYVTEDDKNWVLCGMRITLYSNCLLYTSKHKSLIHLVLLSHVKSHTSPYISCHNNFVLIDSFWYLKS